MSPLPGVKESGVVALQRAEGLLLVLETPKGNSPRVTFVTSFVPEYVL